MMLDKSMIDRQVFTPQLEFNSLKDVIRDAVDIMKGQASYSNITLVDVFKKDKDITIKMDKMRSLQIILNLVSNALKFSFGGQNVQVICDYDFD